MSTRKEFPGDDSLEVTAAHVRAAIGLLGWNQAELAQRAGVTPTALNRFLKGHVEPRSGTREKLRDTLVAAGVVFTNGSQPGVYLQTAHKEILLT